MKTEKEISDTYKEVAQWQWGDPSNSDGNQAVAIAAAIGVDIDALTTAVLKISERTANEVAASIIALKMSALSTPVAAAEILAVISTPSVLWYCAGLLHGREDSLGENWQSAERA